MEHKNNHKNFLIFEVVKKEFLNHSLIHGENSSTLLLQLFLPLFPQNLKSDAKL